MIGREYLLIGLCVLITCFSAQASADWKDLWKSPEQRALQRYQDGDYETLLRESPDASWTGLGEFKSQDYSAASQSFAARVEELRAAGDNQAANRALYNQGVSDVMAGQYEQAIEHFDDVLSENPAMDDAQRNRRIAQDLLTLQQQNESEQSVESGEDSEQGEPGESGEQQEQSQEGDSAEQSQSDAQKSEQSGHQPESADSQDTDTESAQNNPSTEGSAGDEDEETASQTDTEREQEAEAAREALAAEASQQTDQAKQGDESEGFDVDSMTERPLSEAEQATEQLLRRIPDDPAGLLRRKLEQSHRNEFPEVRNAAEPW